MTIKTYLLRCKTENIIWLFWIFVNSICVFLNGMFSANAITALVTLNLRAFLLFGLGILLVNTLWALQIYQGAKASEKAIQSMNNEIRKDILLKLEKAGISNFEQKNQSTYLSWLTNDIQTITDLGFETLELMIKQSLNIVFAVIAFVSFNYSILVTIVIFFILMIRLPKLFNKKLEVRTVSFTKRNEELVQAIDDVLKGYRNLSNNNKISFMTSKVLKFANEYSTSRIEYAKTLGGLMSVQNGTSFISQIVVLLHAGILYFYKLIPIGGVSSSQYFASIIFAGLTGLTANYAEFKSVHKVFEKFQDIVVEEDSEVIEKQSLTKLEGNICLNDVTIIRGQQVLFQNLQLNFLKNHKYAIIGNSGIGKSTLLKLINQELSLAKGKLTYDNISASELKRTTIQNNISYISLDDHIFNETVRFNLTLGVERTTDEINTVLEKLHLKDWLDNLPSGLETKLSQTNLDISSGQKQRLILARALLENKPIWLIDEGTSAIDEKLRLEIEREILVRDNTTILFVTHHLSDNLLSFFDEKIDLNKYHVAI